MAAPTDEPGTDKPPTTEFRIPTQPAAGAVPSPPQTPTVTVKKSRAGLVFGILAVVFFLAAGVTGATFMISKGASDRTIADQEARIASLEADVEARDGELAELQADLAQATDELETAQAAVADSDACRESVQSFFEAVDTDEQAATLAVFDLATTCDVSIG